MIKNKTQYIKIIFKIYLKILKIGFKHFRFLNIVLSYKNQIKFSKTVLKNYFLKLFSKTVINNN